MHFKTVLNWITGIVACLFVLSFFAYVQNATHQMVTYVHGLFTDNTCNRASWIWGCKPQSDATQTASRVHMAAQGVLGVWLILAIFIGVCITPGATSNITSNSARMGMPAIMPITGRTMRSVSWTPMKDKASKNEEPAGSAHWSMRRIGNYVVAAVWKPFVSVLMTVTGQSTVRAADY